MYLKADKLPNKTKKNKEKFECIGQPAMWAWLHLMLLWCGAIKCGPLDYHRPRNKKGRCSSPFCTQTDLFKLPYALLLYLHKSGPRHIPTNTRDKTTMDTCFGSSVILKMHSYD